MVNMKNIGWGVLSLVLCALPIVVIVLAPSTITGGIEEWWDELLKLFDDGVWPLNELGRVVYVVVAFLVIGGALELIPFVYPIESQRKIRIYGYFFLAIGIIPFVFAILNIVCISIKPVFLIPVFMLYIAFTVISINKFVRSIKGHSPSKESYDRGESKRYLASPSNNKVFVDANVSDGLEKRVAECLANGLINNNISEFSPLLDENASQVTYMLGHLGWYYKKDIGKQQIELFWKIKMRQVSKRCFIFRDDNLQKEILKIGNGESIYVIFILNNQNKICRIFVHDTHIYKTNYSNKKEELLPMLEKLSIHTVNIGFETDNHLPCINCGKESSDLIWFGYNTKDVHGGNISFCPTCRNVVEHIYPHVLRHINHPNNGLLVDENIDYIKKNILNTNYIREPGLYIGGKLKNSDEEVLSKLDCTIDGTIVDKLIYAANNGVYEAYNNLGFKMIGENNEKVVEYFKLGVKHGVKNCILNLMFWYLAQNEDSLFVELTEQLTKIKDPIGLYNYAVLLHAGKEFGFNPRIDEAVKFYREAINESSRKQTEDNNYNFILQNANYNLGMIFYEKYGTYKDMLQAYAYLNECSNQNDKVRNLKVCIYKSLCEMKKDNPSI